MHRREATSLRRVFTDSKTLRSTALASRGCDVLITRTSSSSQTLSTNPPPGRGLAIPFPEAQPELSNWGSDSNHMSDPLFSIHDAAARGQANLPDSTQLKRLVASLPVDGLFISVDRLGAAPQCLRWIRIAESEGFQLDLPASFLVQANPQCLAEARSFRSRFFAEVIRRRARLTLLGSKATASSAKRCEP